MKLKNRVSACYIPNSNDVPPYLQTLYINRQDRYEECMHEEPMRNEHNDRKSAELPNGAVEKKAITPSTEL